MTYSAPLTIRKADNSTQSFFFMSEIGILDQLTQHVTVWAFHHIDDNRQDTV